MKKLIISLFISLFLIIPIGVNAESSITIKCDNSENNAGEILNCTLSSKVDSGTVYNKIEGDIDIGETDTITFKGATGFSGDISNNKLTINNSSKVGDTDIGTLQIKFNNTATGNKTINFSNIKLYNDTNEVGTINNVEASVKVKSTVNTLESLTVSDCNNCKLSPSFKTSTTIYTTVTKSNQIRINAKASGNATVTGTGLKTLTKGSETFTLKVTSEAGKTKNYKVIVSKEATISADASLKSITLDKGKLTPDFSDKVTSYSATVDSDKVLIKATATNSKATVKGDGEKKLDYGRNEFTIIVTAEDGTTKSYLININRPDTRNVNAYLKSLTIDGKDIDFEKDIVEYVYNIDDDVEKLEIEAISELESSKVEIEGNENFKPGENIVTITVKAEDGSEKVYKIIAIKGEVSKEKIYLDELKVSGYNIEFSKEKFDYTVKIKDEKELDIIVFSGAGYETEIVGNENLKDGSIIKIIVTDDEGNSSVYKIKIQKANNEEVNQVDEEINYIPIIMTSLLIILFILDTIQVIKRIKNK